MAKLIFQDIAITGIATCVPQKIVKNQELETWLGKEEVVKTVKTIGIEERRVVDNHVCSSDLCYQAAKKLIESKQIDPQSIDVVLFLSQTPDFIVPATAPILQHRLGLPKSCMAMDLSLACSGYVYGLSSAFSYAQNKGIKRVLLLVGETFTKIVNARDKVNTPLYGDAGTATLIESVEGESALFMLYSDGSGHPAVVMPSGGFRNYPLKASNLIDQEREDSNIRKDIEVYMDGMDVFNFAMSVVPKSIKECVKEAGAELSDIDQLIYHQSNKFMTDFFTKRLKFDPDKVPYCIQKYGNTSSASIPLTISSVLSDKVGDEIQRVVMCGYGAGLSWGTALLSLKHADVYKPFDYEDQIV